MFKAIRSIRIPGLHSGKTISPRTADGDHSMLMRQLTDYTEVGFSLVSQRLMIYLAALGMAAFYYENWIVMVSAPLIAVSEGYDYVVGNRVKAAAKIDTKNPKTLLWAIYLGTILSASVICFFSISIAISQGHTTHFMSLFLLFAASLFAAMNNHQIFSVLALRLVVYGITFIFIPVRDIWITHATLDSELWAQFFTIIFVLYFIVDCSRIYMKLYRRNLMQLENLRIEHEKSKAAFKAKSDFIATVSHELRTPLSSLKGGVALSLSGALGELPEKVRSTLQLAQRNGEKLHKLIDEILDVQRMEANKMTFCFQNTDLESVVRAALEASEPLCEKKKIVVNFTPLPERTTTYADPGRLEQVFTNIIGNAVKFSPQNGNLDVWMERTGCSVRIYFRDEGIGISEDDREKVFASFSQIESSDERRFEGTGLGMSIAKRIMGAHQGSIDFFSNEGAGTTFFVEVKEVGNRAYAQDAA